MADKRPIDLPVATQGEKIVHAVNVDDLTDGPQGTSQQVNILDVSSVSDTAIPLKEGNEFVDSSITESSIEIRSTKKIVAPNIAVDAGTIDVGNQSLKSAGENFTFTNTGNGSIFEPVWMEQGTNAPFARFINEPRVEVTLEASKADILVNPIWNFNTILDDRVLDVTIEVDTTIGNVIGEVYRNGQQFYKAELGLITANQEVTIQLDASSGNTPADVFGGLIYEFRLLSPEGDVRCKGSTLSGIPFSKIGFKRFEDHNVTTHTESNQRQIIRTGIKTNFSVSPQAVDTEVLITADVGGIFEVFFNTNEVIDNIDGVIVQISDQVLAVPVDIVTRKYFVHVNDNGTIGTGTVKATSNDLTRVHIYEYIALSGVLIPETLIANPHVTWSDETLQGILDTDGIRIDDLSVSSPDDLTLGINTTNFDILGNGSNYANSKVNPHILSVTGGQPQNFTYISRADITLPPIDADLLLDPLQWDNNGVLTAVGANNATVQRLMVIGKGKFILLYGQTLFANYDDALLNVNSTPFELPSVLFDAVEVARIIIKGSATDSGDTNEVTIQNSAGEAGGGSGSSPEMTTFIDSDFKLINDVDNTKEAQFDCSDIPSSTTNEYKLPVSSGTLALEEDRDYDLVTSSKLLTKKDVFEMVDSSGGDISITLPSNPDDGERHIFYIKDNTNIIDVISIDPGAPIGNPITVQPNNLQGQWVLDVDFNDSSGQGRGLTQNGTGGMFIANTILGRSVQMYNMQGTSYLTATGYKGIGGSNARTITMWFSANSGLPVSDEAFISWGQGTSGGDTYQIKANSGSSRVDAPDIRNAQRRFDYTNPAIIALYDGSPHHIAVTQSGGNVSSSLFYVDGVAIAYDGQDTSPSANTQLIFDMLIGESITGGSNLNGAVYDVRLWDVALSALEIEAVQSENIGGGVNIGALDENTIVEFAYDGDKWIAADAIFERVLDLYQQIAGLATVASTGDYNDLTNLPPEDTGVTTGIIDASSTKWYRIASTEENETAVINAMFNLTISEGNYNQSCQFAITLQNRDLNFGPSFNLISNMNFSAQTISAVRLVADNAATINDAFHIEIQVTNDADTGDAYFFITEKSPISNLSPVAFTTQPDVPTGTGRISGQWSVLSVKQNLNEALRINQDDFIDYGSIQLSVPKVNLSNLPFSFFSNQQNDTQFTRNDNANVTLGTIISDSVLDNTSLVKWLFASTGNGSLKTSYNEIIGSVTILDLVQTGINVNLFKLIKQGWYECMLQVNFDDGNDGLIYTATLVRLDSLNTVIEVLGIAEHSDLGRSCNTFRWSGFYDVGDSFTLLKTSGSGLNDDLRGRNPRFEIKWIGEV